MIAGLRRILGLLVCCPVVIQSYDQATWNLDAATVDPSKLPPPADAKCWTGVYNKEFCCDLRRGSKGVAECWDGHFNYETCCKNNNPPPQRGPAGQTAYHDFAMAHFIATLKQPGDSDYRAWMAQADLFEFGVYTGSNLRSKVLWLWSEGLKFNTLYGFDSFEGLPQADELFPRGDWSAQAYLGLQGVTDTVEFVHKVIEYERTRLIPGFYNVSLTESLPRDMGMKKAFWINIDCDLYSSTLEALDWMFRHSLVEAGKTHIYLDDAWYYRQEGKPGELEALEENKRVLCLLYLEIKLKYGVTTTTLMRTPPWDGKVGYFFRVDSIASDR